MNILKRIKRLIELSKKDPKALAILESLPKDQLDLIPELGDGKAEFFGQGTEEEFNDLQKEDNGLKAWYDRLRNL